MKTDEASFPALLVGLQEIAQDFSIATRGDILTEVLDILHDWHHSICESIATCVDRADDAGVVYFDAQSDILRRLIATIAELRACH